MHDDDSTPPKYQQDKVEAVVFEIAVESQRIATDDLLGQIVSDRDDEREVGTFANAVSTLREYGVLMADAGGGMIEPTPAAIKSAELRI